MKLDEFKNSKKAKFICLCALSVFLYAFLVLFIFGFKNNASFWISFVFSVLSIVLAYFIAFLGVSSARRLTDWIFSMPIIRWCAIYAAVEIIIATVFMIINVPWKVVFLIQFILPILFLVLVVPCFVQKSHVVAVKEETAVKVSYIRSMHAKLVALLPRTEDPAVKKHLEHAVDLLRHSDPMSAKSLVDIERKLSDQVDELDALIRVSKWEEAEPIAKEICLLVEERNQLAIAAKLTQY